MRWIYILTVFPLVSSACTPDDSTGLSLEVCDNGVDDDSNGAVDCDDPRCSAAQNCLAEASCGDGVRGGLEFCDGADLGGASCETQGFAAGVGSLGCRPDCAGFDTSACIRIDLCGNGVREGGEACDGDDFGSSSCLTAGFAEGTLTCADQCQLDTSACSGINPCGNGTLDNGELCDGVELDGNSCATLGFRGEGLACSSTCDSFDTSACDPEPCGNGRIDPGELCDGPPENRGCVDEGFATGRLGCSDTCDAYVTTECSLCGNGVIDDGEVCDGAALGGNTCELEGFFGGELACNGTCDGFDTVSCNDCGNGVLDDGEVCEGDPEAADPPVTCLDVGYQGGSLGCSSDCRSFATELCTGFSECGNGVLDGQNGDRGFQEFCEPGVDEFVDPVNLNVFKLADGCLDFAGVAGDVACNADCTLNFEGCAGFPANSTFCELRSDFLGVCNPCDRIDGVPDIDCQPLNNPTCGDNVADGELGPSNATSPYDWCDGEDLREQTCETLGFAGGTLRCRDDCNFDTSQCTDRRCGDLVIQGREVCDGDRPCAEADNRFSAGTTDCSDDCFDEDVSACEE